MESVEKMWKILWKNKGAALKVIHRGKSFLHRLFL